MIFPEGQALKFNFICRSIVVEGNMVQALRLSLLISVTFKWQLISVKAQNDGNAFSDNINYCLFDRWNVVGKSRVLAGKVSCNGHERSGLCYGLNGRVQWTRR